MPKITNEEALLKYIAQNANEYGEIDINKTLPDDVISPHDLHILLESLNQKGFIRFNDLDHFSITPIGRQAYVPTSEKITKSTVKGLKITIKQVVLFLIGILSAIVIAVALKWLGLE